MPFSVWTCTGFPPSGRYRMSSRRDWKSVVFDVDVSSRYRCCDGSHASRSYFFVADDPSSATPMFTTRYGISKAWSSDSSIASSRSCSSSDSAGSTNENISTLSNWCTRKIPRVSRPAAPASRRKHGEKPA